MQGITIHFCWFWQQDRGRRGATELGHMYRPGQSRGTEKEGEPLFDKDGKETPYLQHTMKMLAELIEASRARLFTEHMAALELIRPIQLDLKVPGRVSRQATGL
jgi:hypothetical protein